MASVASTHALTKARVNGTGPVGRREGRCQSQNGPWGIPNRSAVLTENGENSFGGQTTPQALDEELDAGYDPLRGQVVVGYVRVEEDRVFANGTRGAREDHVQAGGLAGPTGPDAQPELLVLCDRGDRSPHDIVIGGLCVRFVREDGAAGLDAVAADIDRGLGLGVLALDGEGQDDVGIAFSEHKVILAGGEEAGCGGVVADEGGLEGGTTNGHVMRRGVLSIKGLEERRRELG